MPYPKAADQKGRGRARIERDRPIGRRRRLGRLLLGLQQQRLVAVGRAARRTEPRRRLIVGQRLLQIAALEQREAMLGQRVGSKLALRIGGEFADVGVLAGARGGLGEFLRRMRPVLARLENLPELTEY